MLSHTKAKGKKYEQTQIIETYSFSNACCLELHCLKKYTPAANMYKLILINSKCKHRCPEYLLQQDDIACLKQWHSLRIQKKCQEVGIVPVLHSRTASILKAVEWLVSDKQVLHPLPPHKVWVGFCVFFLQIVLGMLRTNDRLWLCAPGFAAVHAGGEKAVSDEGLWKKSPRSISGESRWAPCQKSQIVRDRAALWDHLQTKLVAFVIHTSTYARFGVEVSVKDLIILKKEL